MATLTKITRNFQVTIPPGARRALKLKVGDFVEATAQPNGVLLRPAKIVSERSFEQELRRRLREARADFKAGRTSGPFATAEAGITHLHRQARSLKQSNHKR